jgi:hypothetical protein
MSAAPKVDVRTVAPHQGTRDANFAVEPHEQIYQRAMERFAAIGDEWAATVRRMNGRP